MMSNLFLVTALVLQSFLPALHAQRSNQCIKIAAVASHSKSHRCRYLIGCEYCCALASAASNGGNREPKNKKECKSRCEIAGLRARTLKQFVVSRCARYDMIATWCHGANFARSLRGARSLSRAHRLLLHIVSLPLSLLWLLLEHDCWLQAV